MAAEMYINDVYCFGGVFAGAYLDRTESCLALQGPAWNALAPMPTARAHASAVMVGGLIFVIGGENGSGYLNTVEVYNPATNTWLPGATPMPTARSKMAAVAMGGRIYVAGGYNGSYLTTLEIYDPNLNTWTTGPAMPTARAEFKAKAFNVTGGWEMHCIGGRGMVFGVPTVLGANERFSTISSSWQIDAPMPTPRARLGLGDEYNFHLLFASGGELANGSITDITEQYDPQSNVWNATGGLMGPLRAPRADFDMWGWLDPWTFCWFSLVTVGGNAGPSALGEYGMYYLYFILDYEDFSENPDRATAAIQPEPPAVTVSPSLTAGPTVVRWPNTSARSVVIEVYDTAGRRHLARRLPHPDGLMMTPLNLEGLPDGQYLVRTVVNGVSTTNRVLLHH